jgi:hypothetical protein
MNGNITESGIEKDVEWFKRVGVGGFMNFDGAGSIPRLVEKPLLYMTPEWKQAFRFSMQKADELGLGTAVAASPGWSETGGPWVKPEDAMKKYVWTETWVDGGKRFAGTLPHPPDATGTFQNLKGSDGYDRGDNLPRFYKDTRVFAFRVPPLARPQAELSPKITASSLAGKPEAGAEGVELAAATLSDGDVTNATNLPLSTLEKPTWVRFEYKQPVAVDGLTIASNGTFAGFLDTDSGPSLRVEASADGKTWRGIAESVYNGTQRTIAFPLTRARIFRVVFLPEVPQGAVAGFSGARGGSPTTPGGTGKGGTVRAVVMTYNMRRTTIAISELVLRTLPTVNLWEVKANFGSIHDYYAVPTPKGTPAIPIASVVDLTKRMSAEGHLDWTPPPGQWVVVRMGYSLTGHQNAPASAEATGLEVDKLDPKRVAAYMDTYLSMFASATGPDLIGKRGLQNIMNDSYEAGYQNWTDDILEQFKTRRGYDATPHLPALIGVTVGSAETSDRFLWDWRRTLDEGMAQHYAVVAKKAQERGLGSYAEAQEDRRGYFGDDMEMRQYATVPMGASGNLRNFAPGKESVETYRVDNVGAASVAHIYGRPVVGSESFTGAPVGSMPADLKRVADMLALSGVNRYIIHTSAHQPLDSGPGITLNGIGTFFTRNETWAEEARPWIDYLGRVSSMLQQGRFVADVAYFYGQEAPITGIWGRAKQTDVPTGYGYDFVNADVILNEFSVDGNGKLTTKSGMSYSILYLGGSSKQMTAAVLNKLKSFVDEGATVVGPKPTNSPSLDGPDAAFQQTAAELWGDGSPGVHLYGKGRVIVGDTPIEALERIGLGADWMPTLVDGDKPIGAIHRRVDGGDIYYVVNRRDTSLSEDVSFRTSGKIVELWDPVTGLTREASYRTDDGRTVVSVDLDSMGSVFVVMLQPGAPSHIASEKTDTDLYQIQGAWTVQFQAGRGAPAETILPYLASLSEQSDPGIKYFSGTATYSRTVDVPAAELGTGGEVWLDLGSVRDISNLTLNGKDSGTLWRAPYRYNVTGLLHAGINTVTVKVTNSWFNRLVGDQQAGMKQITLSPLPGVAATTPLVPSGLIGPVAIIQRK